MSVLGDILVTSVTVDTGDLGGAGGLVGAGAQPLRNLQQLFWFDVRVSEEVRLEVGSLIKTPLTDWTPVRSLLVVEDLMDCQGSVLAKTLATIITFERFLLAVNVAMIPGIYCTVRKFISDSLWNEMAHLKWSCLRKALPQISQG